MHFLGLKNQQFGTGLSPHIRSIKILAVILILLEVSTVPVGGGMYSTTFPEFVLRLPRFPSNVQLAVPVVPSTSAEIDTLFAPASISGVLAAILRLTGVVDEGA